MSIHQPPSLAERILAGDMPQADYPIWTAQQWRDEAQMALDCEDEDELYSMLAMQREEDAKRNRSAIDAYFGRGAHNRHMIERAQMEPVVRVTKGMSK